MKPEVPDIAIVLPVLDERENLECLLPSLKNVLRGMGLTWEIIVSDGGSVDGSREVAAQHGASVIQQQDEGFGGALRAGFAAATAPYIVTMDADLSHRPDFLPRFWQHRDEAELLIASRFVAGGKADMGLFRFLLSHILNLVNRSALSLPLRDLSSGFRMYRRGILDWHLLKARDFDVQVEMLVEIHSRGFRIKEVPFHYMPRNSGKSHAKLLSFGWAFSKTLFRMRRLRNSASTTRFVQGVE